MKFIILCYLLLSIPGMIGTGIPEKDNLGEKDCGITISSCYSGKDFDIPKFVETTNCTYYDNLETYGKIAMLQCFGSTAVKADCKDSVNFQSLQEDIASMLDAPSKPACPKDCTSCSAFEDALKEITDVPVDTCLSRMLSCTGGKYSDFPVINDPNICASYETLETNGELEWLQCLGSTETKDFCKDSAIYESLQVLVAFRHWGRLGLCPDDCTSCTSFQDAIKEFVGDLMDDTTCVDSLNRCFEKVDEKAFEAATSKLEIYDICGILRAGKSTGRTDAVRCLFEEVEPNIYCFADPFVSAKVQEVREDAAPECPEDCKSDCEAYFEMIGVEVTKTSSGTIANVGSFSLMLVTILSAFAV